MVGQGSCRRGNNLAAVGVEQERQILDDSRNSEPKEAGLGPANSDMIALRQPGAYRAGRAWPYSRWWCGCSPECGVSCEPGSFKNCVGLTCVLRFGISPLYNMLSWL
jgi:hypothetical protein